MTFAELADLATRLPTREAVRAALPAVGYVVEVVLLCVLLARWGERQRGK